MPLFDINEFWDSGAQIGGLGLDPNLWNPRFLTQTGNDKPPLPLPSKLTTLSVPVRSYYFEKGKFDGWLVQW